MLTHGVKMLNVWTALRRESRYALVHSGRADITESRTDL